MNLRPSERLSTWLVAFTAAVSVLSACGGLGNDPLITRDHAVEAAEGSEDQDEVFSEVGMDDPRPANGVARDELSGTSWTMVFGTGPDGEIRAVDGFPITLGFDGDTLGGTAACNDYGSAYNIDGSRFILVGLSVNEVGCAGDVQAAEAAFLAALLDVETIRWTPELELILSGSSSELIFVAP